MVGRREGFKRQPRRVGAAATNSPQFCSLDVEIEEIRRINGMGKGGPPLRQGSDVRVVAMGLLVFLASMLFGTRCIAAGPEEFHSGTFPLVSIDAILERNVRPVRNVQWFDVGHLSGEFNDPESGKTFARLISMTGALEAPLGDGRLTAISPDGQILLQRVGKEWFLRDLNSERSVRIKEPADEAREFSSYLAPVWSRTGRYAAILDYYRPIDLRAGHEPIKIAGIPVIDVGATAPANERWTSRITVVDRRDPGQVRRVIVDDILAGVDWGPDDSLFVSQTSFFGVESATVVLRVPPGAENAVEMYRSRGRFQTMTPVVHPNGDKIAVVLDIDNRAWSDFESILIIDSNTGRELQRLTHNLPVIANDYVWSHNGEEIYARVRNGGLDQIYAIPLRGEPRRLTIGARRHFDMDLSPDGRRLSYQTEDGYGRKDIRVFDLETGKENVVLVVDEPANEFRLGEWTSVRWNSSDGVRPFGYLFFPTDFNSNQEYPMIVDVHGGGSGSSLYLSAPLTVGVSSGPLEWHAWAALGYVVFVPDYRSTGDYGSEVISARYNAGEPAVIKDIEDIVSGTRSVIDRGFVDPSRVAIFGHSAGGQRAYVLLNNHDLYAAAILNESIPPGPASNFIYLASGKHTGGYPAAIYRQYYGGALSDVPARYKTNYMLDSYNNKTPTLIMMGNEALGGMPHMPNEVLYSILKQHGVHTRFLKFVEEGHVYRRPEAAKIAFGEVRNWLETHMPVNLTSVREPDTEARH